MKVEVVRPADLGHAERARWLEFQTADPWLSSPFLSYEFTAAAARHRPGTRVGVLHDDGGIAGFFPFDRGRFGAATGVAALLNEAGGLIHRVGYSWDARELLDKCGLGVWEFDHLVPGQQPFDPFTTLRAPSPVMDLSGGYDAYLAAARERSSRIKDLPRRRRRLAREVGDVRFEFATDDPAALGTLMAWKSEQYRRTARMDRFARPWIRDVVRDVARLRTPSCSGVVSLLWAGDHLIAGHIGLRSERVLPTWFPTYDPDHARYSPGLLLHLAMAEAGSASGLDHIDLGRGPKDYKNWLADFEYEVGEGRVVGRHSAAALHWVTRTPVRSLRNAVVTNSRAYDAADRALKAYGSVRASLERKEPAR